MKISLDKGTPQGNMKLFHAKMKVNTCAVCEIGLLTEDEEEDGEIGVLPTLRVLSCIKTPIGHVMYLKRLITAAFRSWSGFIMLGLDGHVGAIPT